MLRVARAVALVRAGVIDELPAGRRTHGLSQCRRFIAEMCGNGVRVFAHYLRASGLVDSDEFTVGSRAGARPVVVHSFDELHADVRCAQMGPVTMGADATVRIGDDLYPGVAVDVGNPHLACVVPDMSVDDLGAVDFSTGVLLPDDMFPHGANVELLTAPDGGADHRHATMRLRTRRRGDEKLRTGLVAAAAVVRCLLDRDAGEMVIDVPGGGMSILPRERSGNPARTFCSSPTAGCARGGTASTEHADSPGRSTICGASKYPRARTGVGVTPWMVYDRNITTGK